MNFYWLFCLFIKHLLLSNLLILILLDQIVVAIAH